MKPQGSDSPTQKRHSGQPGTDWFNASLMQPLTSSRGETSQTRNLSAANEDNIGEQFSMIAAEAIKSSQTLVKHDPMVAAHNRPSRVASLGRVGVCVAGSQQTSRPGGYPASTTGAVEGTYRPRVPRPVSVQSALSQVGTSQAKDQQKQLCISHQSRPRFANRRRSFHSTEKPQVKHLFTHTMESEQPAKSACAPSDVLPAAPSCSGVVCLPQVSEIKPLMPTIKPEHSQIIRHSFRGVSSYDLRTCQVISLRFYTVHQTIGSGNFSKVKLATHNLTKEKVAIKVLDKVRSNTQSKRLFAREISILEQLHHPGIVRLYEVIESLSRIFLVIEFVPGGDLHSRVSKYGKFIESEAKIIFAQLIAAVNHLHERNIYHRDIKAENILFTHKPPSFLRPLPKASPVAGGAVPHRYLLDGRRPLFKCPNIKRLFKSRSREIKLVRRSPARTNRDANILRAGRRAHAKSQDIIPRPETLQPGQDSETDIVRENEAACYPELYRIKLIDFGLSKCAPSPDQQLSTACGSPAYAAPELYGNDGYQGGPVDMWALGIVLFYMLTNSLPFDASSLGAVRRRILENHGKPLPDWISMSASALYEKLTSRNPSDRPTANAILLAAQPKPVDQVTSLSQLRLTAFDDQWKTWLEGQKFPKAFPRFSQSAPLLLSVRRPVQRESESYSVSTTTHTSTERSGDGANLLDPTPSSSLFSPASTPADSPARHPLATDEDCHSHAASLPQQQPTASTSSGAAVASSEETDEVKAARMLLNLGMTKEDLVQSKNLEARCAVTGAYRIILHRMHRNRRLSYIDPDAEFRPPSISPQPVPGTSRPLSRPLSQPPTADEREDDDKRKGNKKLKQKRKKFSKTCKLI